MKSLTTDYVEYVLIPVAVVLLAVFRRLDLLTVIVPLSLLAGYAASSICKGDNSSRRRI